ncbi:MAG: hypothetical protein JSR09_03650 [Bacteroidetes bacterium]|nr:hypothetical protein [Bacteroidota bacterium]MBS1648778.1 hypothetical protein [Bacteroidota bacterium]
MTDALNEFEEKKLPSTLNVLTILTIIGCAIGLLGGFWQFATADKNVAQIESVLNNPTQYNALPDFAKKFMSPEALENAKLVAANKVPILALNLIGCVLCFVGALQMRKYKMQGFYYWLVGEVVPVIGGFIFMGNAMTKGWGLLGLVIPLVFIFLYTAQRKHLTEK